MKLTRVIYLIMVVLCSSCGAGISDYNEVLPGKYEFISESSEQQFIHGEGNHYIPCTVKEYSYNKTYILAVQSPHEPCLHTEAINGEILKIAPLQFWIIDVDKDRVYGPLLLSEYLSKRQELGIPEVLKLKLKI